MFKNRISLVFSQLEKMENTKRFNILYNGIIHELDVEDTQVINILETAITSSLETLSEKSIPLEKDTQSQESDFQNNSETVSNEVELAYSCSEFFQPDPKVHSRFLDELDEEDEESTDEEDMEEDKNSELEFEWVTDTDKTTLAIRTIEKPKSIATIVSHDAASVQSSSIRKIRSSSTRSKNKPDRKSTQEENGSSQAIALKKQKGKAPKQEKILGENELLNAWLEYNMWEQRKKDMEDPSIGWKPLEPELCAQDCICSQIEYAPEDFENEEYLQIKREWLEYLDKHKLAIDQHTQNLFVHSCLLLIIKQFVFDYFHESFQYKLVKMSYQIVPNLTYEKLNTKWRVPKENKEEFKRPVEKKPKPQKPVKEKSPKKDKKKKEKLDKKSKSSKGSSKKEKPHKVKPEKPHKLTKEEKEEIERLKREEEQKMNEEIAAEENRRFIFPLGLAANEEFFKGIFKDFVVHKEPKDKAKDKKKKK